MCDPVSLTALALTAGGSFMQYRAQQQREHDMRNLQSAETQRQDRYYADSKKYFDQNQGEFDKNKVDANMLEAARNRQQQYAAADANAPRANEQLPGSTAATGGNSVVTDAFMRALATAKEKAGAQGAARSQLASFGDFLNNAAIDNARRSGYIGMNGSFMNGSSNVLPLELQAAATKRRPLATAGNLLTAFGSALLGAPGASSLFAAKTPTAITPATGGFVSTPSFFENVA